MNLLEEVRNWYTNITKYYEESGYNKIYELNTFWKGGNFSIVKEILEQSKDDLDFLHRIQGTVLYQLTTGESHKLDAVKYELDLLNESNIDIFKMPDFVQESDYMRQDHVIEIQGRKFTTDFFRYLNSVLLIEKYKQEFSSHPMIMELGAGTGNFARLLKLFIPKSTYIIVDIPETLIFSYSFLKLNFPNAKILLASTESDLKGKNYSDYDFIFTPTKFAEVFVNQKIDLFVNTASLGEMTNPVIKYWMNFIQNDLKPKTLYTLNRYLNVFVPFIQDDSRKEENLCSVLYDRNWEIKHWQIDPQYLKCPYDYTRHARYLEIFAVNKAISSLDAIAESNKLFDEISRQDWHREFDIHKNDKIVKYRMHVLSYDTSSKGTIFKLWNILRLDPENKNALKAIIKYLYLMTPGGYAEFEEYFYYKECFLAKYSQADYDDRNFAQWIKDRDGELLYNPNVSIISSHSSSSIMIGNNSIDPELSALLQKLLNKNRKRKAKRKKLRSILKPIKAIFGKK